MMTSHNAQIFILGFPSNYTPATYDKIKSLLAEIDLKQTGDPIFVTDPRAPGFLTAVSEAKNPVLVALNNSEQATITHYSGSASGFGVDAYYILLPYIIYGVPLPESKAATPPISTLSSPPKTNLILMLNTMAESYPVDILQTIDAKLAEAGLGVRGEIKIITAGPDASVQARDLVAQLKPEQVLKVFPAASGVLGPIIPDAKAGTGVPTYILAIPRSLYPNPSPNLSLKQTLDEAKTSQNRVESSRGASRGLAIGQTQDNKYTIFIVPQSMARNYPVSILQDADAMINERKDILPGSSSIYILPENKDVKDLVREIKGVTGATSFLEFKQAPPGATTEVLSTIPVEINGASVYQFQVPELFEPAPSGSSILDIPPRTTIFVPQTLAAIYPRSILDLVNATLSEDGLPQRGRVIVFPDGPENEQRILEEHKRSGPGHWTVILHTGPNSWGSELSEPRLIQDNPRSAGFYTLWIPSGAFSPAPSPDLSLLNPGVPEAKEWEIEGRGQETTLFISQSDASELPLSIMPDIRNLLARKRLPIRIQLRVIPNDNWGSGYLDREAKRLGSSPSVIIGGSEEMSHLVLRPRPHIPGSYEIKVSTAMFQQDLAPAESMLALSTGESIPVSAMPTVIFIGQLDADRLPASIIGQINDILVQQGLAPGGEIKTIPNTLLGYRSLLAEAKRNPSTSVHVRQSHNVTVPELVQLPTPRLYELQIPYTEDQNPGETISSLPHSEVPIIEEASVVTLVAMLESSAAGLRDAIMEEIDQKLIEAGLWPRTEIKTYTPQNAREVIENEVKRIWPQNIVFIEMVSDAKTLNLVRSTTMEWSAMPMPVYNLEVPRPMWLAYIARPGERRLIDLTSPIELKAYSPPTDPFDIKSCPSLEIEGVNPNMFSGLTPENGVQVFPGPNEWKQPRATAAQGLCYPALNLWALLITKFLSSATRPEFIRHFREAKFPIVPDVVDVEAQSIPGLLPPQIRDPVIQSRLSEEFWYHVAVRAGTRDLTLVLIQLHATPVAELRGPRNILESIINTMRTFITQILTPMATTTSRNSILDQLNAQVNQLNQYLEIRPGTDIRRLVEFRNSLTGGRTLTTLIQAFRQLESNPQDYRLSDPQLNLNRSILSSRIIRLINSFIESPDIR